MISPASDKVVALSALAAEALEQGSVLRFVDNGDGRVSAFRANATTDFTEFGTFLAYFITPDSEDVEFKGAPESVDFNLNTDTGVGGGTQTIASGSEFAALGGRALIRLDRFSVHNDPADLTAFTPGLNLEADSTTGMLALAADGDLNANAAKVVANDGATIVVLLR